MSDDLIDHETHPSLLLRIRDPEDRQAWITFSEVYAPLIFGYYRKRGIQESDAADIAQEVLSRVWKAIPHFDYDPVVGRFRDWLGRLTHRELLRFWQRDNRRREQSDGESVLATSPADQSLWEEHFHETLLRTAMGRIESEFEPLTWRAFLMTWMEGKESSDVAVELETPIDRIYVAKSRVLKRLRAEIVALSDDLPMASS